jgi:signal transduction histidine kinase
MTCCDTDNAMLIVSDTGIGILPDEMAHIFDRFYRSDRARSTADGTCLGLAIVREIVQLHNGQLTIDSTPDVGTKVTVTLPLRRSIP